jgi:hypothetical protein
MPPRATERAVALEAAAALLALAMHESQGPVDVLGGALERMTRALARSQRALARQRALEQRRPAGHDQTALADIDASRETFEREIAVCIEGLQFHDRLMQQLAHVRDSLAAVLSDRPDRSARDGGESWMDLRARLWKRLSSDSQRALLDLLLPTTTAHTGGELRKINASEGSIELF